ncbi:MAG: carboxypeptidase regulatory-like domain-containing protein [Gemmatimonadales bacterium]|nr:carboxypeptidase regulatory-like domain-containing protein [Gemmatimonadales bacterium]
MPPRPAFLSRFLIPMVSAIALAGCPGPTPPNPPPPPPPPQAAVIGSLAGTVSAESAPLAGVQLKLDGNGTSRSATSGTDGRYQFDNVAAGNYTASVVNPDPELYTFDPGSKPVTIAATTPDVPFAATIKRTAAINGLVTIDNVGRPGIVVRVTGPESVTDHTTDSQGRYTAANRRAGAYAVAVQNPDPTQYGFTPPTATVTLASGQTRTVDFAGATVVPPAIALSTTSIAFAAVQGGAAPTPQQIGVTNAGGGTLGGLTVTVTHAAGQPTGWLAAALDGATAPSTLTLTPTPGALVPGTYAATVAVSGPGASNTPRPIAVTLTVTAAPILALGAPTVGFAATVGGANPANRTVAVTNAGGGTLDGLATAVTYAAGQPTGWLTANVTPTTAPAVVTLSAATAGLAAGAYAATVAVSATAANSPQTIGVTFVVGGGALIALSTNSATFAAIQNGTAPGNQTIQIANGGLGTLGGLGATVSYPGPTTGWLTATLSSTTAPATLTLAAATNLPIGTHGATVSVQSGSASNSPVSVAVTYTVGAPGTLQVLADDLNYGLGLYPPTFVPSETLLWGPRVQLKTVAGANQAQAGVAVTAGNAVITSGATGTTNAQGVALFRNILMGPPLTAALTFSAPNYTTATGLPTLSPVARTGLGTNGAVHPLASNSAPNYVTFIIPPNATGARIQTGATSGGVDFWAKRGAAPTIYSADCESVQSSGGTGVCAFGPGTSRPLTTGFWYISGYPRSATGSYFRPTWWDCATRPSLVFGVATAGAISGTDCQAPEVATTRDRYRLPNLPTGTTTGVSLSVSGAWPWTMVIKETNSAFWSWTLTGSISVATIVYAGQPALDLIEGTPGTGGAYSLTANPVTLNSPAGTCGPYLALHWGISNLLDFTIASGDCPSNTKGTSASDRFFVRLDPGQTVEVSAIGVTSGFDPYLICYDSPTLTSSGLLSADDNNGGGTNAYMYCGNSTNAPITVTVEVTTSPVSPIDFGSYRLGLKISPPSSVAP